MIAFLRYSLPKEKARSNITTLIEQVHFGARDRTEFVRLTVPGVAQGFRNIIQLSVGGSNRIRAKYRIYDLCETK